MMKAAADYFKQKPRPLAGFMPRKVVQAGGAHARPNAMAYDLEAIHAVPRRAAEPSAPIRTLQAGASLKKDLQVTSASFGERLKRRNRQADLFLSRLDQLGET